MRIAVLVNFAPRKLGSLEAWLIALAQEAQRRGHLVELYCRTPIHPSFVEALGGTATALFNLQDLEQKSFRSILRLARSYDVLHLNLVAPRSRIALIAYAAWPARVLFVDRFSGEFQTNSSLRSVPRALIDRLTMWRVAGLAGVSEFVRARDVTRFRLSESRSRTIYNGVNIRRFSPVRLRRTARDAVQILCAAHLIADKGVEVLIRALALLQDHKWHLKVAGDGPERLRLQNLARELDTHDRIEFLGLRDDIDELLRRSHIFVHPALWAEAFGFTIAEAMATARPVIASAVGGIPELIAHGESGLLVSPGVHEELASAIRRLIDRPDFCDQLGECARQVILQRFTLDQCVKSHLDWCEAVATSHQR